MVNHGWLTNHGQPWSTYKYLFLPFLSENPMAEPWPANQAGTSTSLLVENRYKVSLLTWDSFVQTGVQWLHKGKSQSLQTCSKMSICVKPIFLYRHILWCQESKVGSVWKWNNLKTLNWHMLGQKKKTSLFPVAGLKIAMRNAFFFFFLQFMKKQCAMRFLFF